MFETATLSSGPRTKRMWATCLGVGGQALLVGGMLMAPLIWPKALPDIMKSIPLASPPVQQSRPKTETRVEPRTRTAVRPTHEIWEPVEVPNKVIILTEAEAPAPQGRYIIGALEEKGGGNNLLAENIIGSVPLPGPARPPDPPAVAPKPPEPVKTMRITEVSMAEPIRRVNPVYPEMAKRARISGKVELMGVLGTDGRLHEVKVISGHPFLAKAAVDAVMQWVYRPTILNGTAVEVQAPITVNFILN